MKRSEGARSTAHLIIIALIVLFFSLLQVSFSLKAKQLPACLYGCDLYSHLGTLYHLAEGGSIFQNGQLAWAKPWTPLLYHHLVVTFSKGVGLELLFGQIWFNVFLFILTCFLLSYLANKIFNSPWLPVFLVLLLSERFPVYKYGDFSFLVTLPLFVFVSYFFIFKKQRNWKTLFLSAFFYGLNGYSHTVSFIGINLYLLLCFLFELWDERSDKINLLRTIRSYVALLCLGFPIALLYWWWPIVNGFHAINPSSRYGDKDFSRLEVGLSESREYFERFFYLQEINIYTVIMIFGSVIFLLQWRGNTLSPQVKRFLAILLLTSFIGMNHHFVTAPILGITAFPGFFALLFLLPIMICFVYLILSYLLRMVPNKLFQNAIIGMLFCLLFFEAFFHQRAVLSGAGLNGHALTPLPNHYLALSSYLQRNSLVSDVILTTKELCFAVNGLTGRKCMVYRSTHTDPFSDVWTSQVEAALALYGDNQNVTKEILEKYEVKYLYWNDFWEESEFLKKDNQSFPFDPLLVPDQKTFRKMLELNNVKFTSGDYWFDPGYQGADIPRLSGIMINADNYYAPEHPWHHSLDPFLSEVWSYNEGGRVVAKLYRVTIPKIAPQSSP